MSMPKDTLTPTQLTQLANNALLLAMRYVQDGLGVTDRSRGATFLVGEAGQSLREAMVSFTRAEYSAINRDARYQNDHCVEFAVRFDELGINAWARVSAATVDEAEALAMAQHPTGEVIASYPILSPGMRVSVPRPVADVDAPAGIYTVLGVAQEEGFLEGPTTTVHLAGTKGRRFAVFASEIQLDVADLKRLNLTTDVSLDASPDGDYEEMAL